MNLSRRSSFGPFIAITASAALLVACAESAPSTSAPPEGTGRPSTSEPAAQAAYPTQPIELIVPWAAGGGADQSARLVAAYATEKFGQPVNVVNVTGASGVTGMLQALQAEPDGYTLMMDGNVTSSFMYASRSDVPIELEDRTLIAQVTQDPMYFFVCQGTGWTELEEALEAARSDPAAFTWGAGAFGSSPMFAEVDLFKAADIDISATNMVVFDEGNAPSLLACGSGDVQFAVGQAPDVESMTATGRVSVLAVNAAERTREYPDVPTTAELGYPEADLVVWYGLIGPAGLPEPVVAAWDEILSQAPDDPEAQQMAEDLRKNWVYGDAADYEAYVMAEYDATLPIAEEMGLRE